ncbi:hypothetical protein PM082_023062 [Marasmius tenuissimus]|nr:hypothetical protein PM082_023062 [Marasmius tenuissimus]
MKVWSPDISARSPFASSLSAKSRDMHQDYFPQGPLTQGFVGRQRKTTSAMIIHHEDEDTKTGSGPTRASQEEAPPPQYEELISSSPVSQPSPSSLSLSTALDGRAVNYIAINKPLGSIDCQYTLDPSVQIPASFLPRLQQGQTEEDRKNLSLKTKVGTIVADVLLQHREGSPVDRRTLLAFRTTLGTMILKLDVTPSPIRPPFQLKATTQSGTIVLHLPRSFHGFLSVTTTIGNVNLSSEVAEVNRWITTGPRVRKAFIGDASQLRECELEPWNGDEVIIETTVGSVEIAFAEAGAVPDHPRGRAPSRTRSVSSSLSSRSRNGDAGSMLSHTSEVAPPPLVALLGYKPLGK